jgi:hypothetical protein
MARHRDQGQSLVTLAENLRQAVTRAKAFCDTIATNRDGIVSVRVEEWVGTLTEGEWRPVSPWYGGFSHRFAMPRRMDKSSNGDGHDPSLPRTGDKVECVLLGQKTRKGGWRAKLLKRRIEGPITNTADVPNPAQPGQTVILRVGAISQDGKRIQFHWQLADNPERRATAAEGAVAPALAMPGVGVLAYSLRC